MLCADLNEGNLENRGYMHTCDWLTSLYSRKWHSGVKQLYSNKNITISLIFSDLTKNRIGGENWWFNKIFITKGTVEAKKKKKGTKRQNNLRSAVCILAKFSDWRTFCCWQFSDDFLTFQYDCPVSYSTPQDMSLWPIPLWKRCLLSQQKMQPSA